jgi:hypothetical protein
MDVSLHPEIIIDINEKDIPLQEQIVAYQNSICLCHL